MLRISNAPTVPSSEEEVIADVDEPPDDKVPELKSNFKKEYMRRPSGSSLVRRESLLTRAIRGENEPSPASVRLSEIPRGLSTTSSHSFASTAELTSDVESPARSVSPSPPAPLNRLHMSPISKPVESGKVVIAPLTADDKATVVPTGEAAIEGVLGRKRCIMFAAGNDTVSTAAKEPVVPKPAEPAPRKPKISFACPGRPVTETNQAPVTAPRRQSSPPPVSHSTIQRPPQQLRRATEATTTVHLPPATQLETIEERPKSPKQVFHEFASSRRNDEGWIEKHSDVSKPKLTIDDCLKKENAIRKIGKEAEEEAEEEEREFDELDNEMDDDDNEDDFAPSDDDAGNESDNEAGFAESDSESDAGSEYRFWAPSATTTRATSIDNMTHFSARQASRSRASSTSSNQSGHFDESRRPSVVRLKSTRPIKMRPGTPELPDSTDFVCGTLDEDRPLEAAYISCREQKRREKHVIIPQDIDPSFPTSDPEDEEDEEDEVDESSDHVWVKGQFEGFDEDVRGRRSNTKLVSPLHSPTPVIAPPRTVRPNPTKRPTHRSPPPKHNIARSPAARRLFDHGPRRMRSPPPHPRLRSPRGSPTTKPLPFGITINHLAQRPNADKTASLPHTPNPFFRNWRNANQTISRVMSNNTASGTDSPNPDLHVRGPVDIVIGLEKKRQKRKEKYWRQHCRKAAKEQAVKKPQPGRGAERMKELGLECAERNRGYGLGQQAQLVLSL